MPTRPPLSVVIGARDGLSGLGPALQAVAPQAERIGAEVLVVGPVAESLEAPVRVVRVDDADLYRLRLAGIHAARGEIVAIGEDHAQPRPDWCEAVLRAHAEHPDAAAVIGCLVNRTTATVWARGNFLSFAAPVQPPMPALPLRVPPVSTLSLKREALAELDDTVGRFEAELVPRLFAEGQMVVDDRIVVDHFQDEGLLWAVANGFHAARASYGYLGVRRPWSERAREAAWALRYWPRALLREARLATRGERRVPELGVVAAVGTGVGVGGAVGSLLGPGRSPRNVA